MVSAEDAIAQGPTLPAADAPAPAAGSSERVAPGTKAGDYVIEAAIGAGAMGEVYAGKHPLIGKRVAVKVIKRHLATSPDAIERFLREARAVNQVGHPNVVDVFAVGRLDDGRLYLVMDLLEGESLRARVARGPLDPDDALAILDAIAAALDAAHERGVVHRDLKPDNVFLAARGGGRPQVYVLDFGIAKLLGAAAVDGAAIGGTLTDQGTWLGTPAYMAPEQWGADGAGPASDRYALGVIAFELLAGRPPFAATSLPAMMEAHFRAAVPSVSTLAGRPLPARADEVLARALAKDPDGRFATAGELVEALRAALGTAVGRRARVAAPGVPARRPVLAIALGGATAIAAVVTGVVVLRGGERAGGAAPPPAPNMALPRVDITSVPAGARVRVGGIDRGATPLVLPLEGGAHEVTVVIDKPGYAPVTRTVRAEDEPLRVTLSPVTMFEGVWALPDGALRAFERRGEQVAMFSMEAGTGERRFERFFEFVPTDPGLVAFVAAEAHIDPRNPDEPSCHVDLRAEYVYDPAGDDLARRQERVKLDYEGGHCTQVAREWGPTAPLRRLAHADGGTWAESTAGAGSVTADAPPDLVPRVPFPGDDTGSADGDDAPTGDAEIKKPVQKKKVPPKNAAGGKEIDPKKAAFDAEVERRKAEEARRRQEEQRQDERRRDTDARDQVQAKDAPQQAIDPLAGD